MAISASYTLTKAEVFRAVWAIAPVRLGTACVALAAAPFLFTIGEPVGPLAIVFLISVEVAGWLGMYSQILKQAAKVGVPTTVTISQRVIVLDLPAGRGAVKWTALARVKSAREFWLFRVGRRRWLIVPKRAFTQAQRAALDEFVRLAAPVVASMVRRRMG